MVRIRQSKLSRLKIADRIKIALHQTFMGSWKKKAAVTGTAVAAVVAADVTLGSWLLAKTGLVKNHSYITKQDPCDTDACKKTAKDILAAVDLWRKTDVERKGGIPSYINGRYALRAAGMESNMGSFTHRPGSKFRGTFQFTCSHGMLLRHHMSRVLKVLNAAKDDIPILKEKLKDGKRLTSRMLCSRKDRSIYNDTTVQTFMKLESVLNAAKNIEETIPGFANLPEGEKHSMLYLSHNLPIMVKVVGLNPTCDRAVKNIIPSQAGNFRANAGVYAGGNATPPEVLARVANFTEPFLVRHMPGHGWGTRYNAPGRGNYGVLHYLSGIATNAARCTARFG